MKRDHIILLSLLLTMMLLSAGNVGAQVPANLARLFDGPYHDNRNATETIITGEPLRRHHLSLFRSLSVTEDADLAAPIEKAVKADGLSALWKETVTKGGRLQSEIYELPTTRKRRYVLYLNSFLKGGNEAAVIYLEGSATPQQIKKLIREMSE